MAQFPAFGKTTPSHAADNPSVASATKFVLVHLGEVGTLKIEQMKLGGSDQEQWVAKEDGKEFILAHGHDRKEVQSRAARILKTIKKSWK